MVTSLKKEMLPKDRPTLQEMAEINTSCLSLGLAKVLQAMSIYRQTVCLNTGKTSKLIFKTWGTKETWFKVSISLFSLIWLNLGTMQYRCETRDPWTVKQGVDMVYEGELDKTSRLAYGKGKCTHIKRPDMSWEGTFINNKRTGFCTWCMILWLLFL